MHACCVLRPCVPGKNHAMKAKNHSLKLGNEEVTKSPKPKSAKACTGKLTTEISEKVSLQKSEMLNSSYSLRSHSIKCTTDQNINDSSAEYNVNNTSKHKYSLRRQPKNLQSINASGLVDKKHTLKFTKKEDPLRSGLVKSSSTLNHGKKSSYSLQSHSIECSTHQNINDNLGGCNKNKTLKQRYSLRLKLKSTKKEDYLYPSILKHGRNSSYSLQSQFIECSTDHDINNNQGEYNKNNKSKHGYSLSRAFKTTKKEDYVYSLRSKQEKTASEKLVAKNNITTSTKALDKLRIRENSLAKSITKNRHGCDIGRKLKLRCHKRQETRKMKLEDIKHPQKRLTKENNTSKLENDCVENDIENGSFNGLISLKKDPKPKTMKKNNRKVLWQRKDSFERYGVLTPSYENVLDNMNQIKIEGNAIDAYEKEYGNLDNSLPLASKIISKVEAREEQSLKDCKHLSLVELQEYFQQNLDHVTSIINGNSTSQRHEKFKNYDPKTHLTMADLTYSPSIVVFNSNQRDVLLELLEDQFDPDGEKTDYLFKVLLPELCSKIFMDVHGMTEDDALNYLNWRPLD